MKKSGKNLESKTSFQGQSNKEYWDIAAKYWRDIATVNPYWAWNSYYAEKIPDEKLTILVLGVTNGSFLDLLKTFRPKTWACGIDFSLRMLKNAQRVEKKVVCCRGDFLPFKNNRFDIVLSDYFLSVIPEESLEMTVKEVERVLKQNGSFIAKELRHQGHILVWLSTVVAIGFLGVAAAFVVPVLMPVFWLLFVLALLGYDPVHHKMGKSAALLKFFLHLFKIVKRRKRVPSLKELSELYYLSKKYLHIFADREMDHAFSDSSLEVNIDESPVSWNFSIVGVKK